MMGRSLSCIRGGSPGSSGIGVSEAFAEAVDPDDLSPDLDRLREQRGSGGHWNAQPWLHQVGAEACGVRGMRRDRRDVGHEVWGTDVNSQSFGHCMEQARLEVRRAVLAVTPEGEHATSPTVVVVQIRYRRRKRHRRSSGWRGAVQRRHVHLLLARMRCPQGRIRTIDDPSVGDDPLSIEGAVAVPDRPDDGSGIRRDRRRAKLMTTKSLPQPFVDVFVPLYVRMEQRLLLSSIGFGSQRLPTVAPAKRDRVRSPRSVRA